jgi:hypothetical protein
VVRDKELNLEDGEASHTLGGSGEGGCGAGVYAPLLSGDELWAIGLTVSQK